MQPEALTFAWQHHAAALFSFTSFAGRRMKIGLAEVAALEHLQVAGALSPGDLGKRLSMPSASVTALLDRLEGKRMIERRANPADRRGVLVGLTPIAMERAALDLMPVAEAMIAAAAHMSEAERETVARYLEMVNACMARQQAQPPAEPRS
ncbi:MarR family winged helix-turn-helix transcriptional regulator [Novosphingobium sp. AAP93]|uniref:MarR family winged helix-turn-helix transcriptional regulator n=1 Tax=Novosphingobium sp. AAP93 TaxID=1523427 RepID=UPI0006B97947|nr:MarR family transcriptional regulator [Novosphingobium sp. AAP93]